MAENTVEACTYLWNLHQVGKLQLDLKPVNATLAYHMPCHMKALEVGSPGESLLRLVPALSVQRVERGCSGMAGTFGLKKRNYRNSLRAGWPLISTPRASRRSRRAPPNAVRAKCKWSKAPANPPCIRSSCWRWPMG